MEEKAQLPAKFLPFLSPCGYKPADKTAKMHKISIYVTVLLFVGVTQAGTPLSPSLHPIVMPANFQQNYSLLVNSTVEYVFLYSATNISSMESTRIKVESNATHSLPLIVVVRQKNGLLSWQIPLTVKSMYFDIRYYNTTTRTLCAAKYYQEEPNDESEKFIAVSISTASPTNVSFNLNVVRVEDFYLSLGESKVVEISPSKPIYYGYSFPEQRDNSSITIRIDSDNDICMTASIQNISCPVFDLEHNVEYSGVWQTISKRGAIAVPKEAYPSGFFLVLVVKGDDTDCDGEPSRKLQEQSQSSQDLERTNYHVPSPSRMEEAGVSIEEDSSLDEDDIDIMEDVLSDKEVIRTKLVLSVCDLARKNPRILRHKSRLYLFYLGTVSIFYTLPAVQLLITYQNVLHVTGNQDMCYYNFLCAHPLGLMSDFNHVFSNFGYILLGLLFILLTYSREQNESDRERNECYGIPQHYGLFYAMGSALIMEGILSGSYHVCPNRSNFQFDTSFMYIIAVLCMIKIYQTRHPDINARAPVTFGVLALIIFISLIGVLNNTLSFRAVFTIIHLLVCLLLTIQIYYMGRWKLNRGLIKRVIQVLRHDARCGITHLFRPVYPARFLLLVMANFCNVGLAVFGYSYGTINFATHLLAILMSNLILYALFYIVMKLCHKERILPQPLIYIILSIVFWGAALYFFIRKTISWADTPAQSRLYNRPCELLNFFDSHDIWHFLSALAMFFSFMVLLTLDDDLIDVHRSQIPVF
ncbi:hypothetical protein KM043_001492 [Ampulex compressa]|nr:hypothetical protein KM043_001492 [Ampulex compressa]